MVLIVADLDYWILAAENTVDQSEIMPWWGYTQTAHLTCLSFILQVDEQFALLQHEKMDLLKRLEEDQEDLNELMKKHKALIAQVLLWTWHHSLSFQLYYSLILPEIKSRSLVLVLQWHFSDPRASSWTGGGEETETLSAGRGNLCYTIRT